MIKVELVKQGRPRITGAFSFLGGMPCIHFLIPSSTTRTIVKLANQGETWGDRQWYYLEQSDGTSEP